MVEEIIRQDGGMIEQCFEERQAWLPGGVNRQRNILQKAVGRGSVVESLLKAFGVAIEKGVNDRGHVRVGIGKFSHFDGKVTEPSQQGKGSGTATAGLLPKPELGILF